MRNARVRFAACALAVFSALPAMGESSLSRDYCSRVTDEVDKYVQANFFDPTLVQSAWDPAYKELQAELAKGKPPQSLAALDKRLNQALHSLKTSHCQFVTQNDESFFFLHSLFGGMSKANRTRPHSWAKPVACTGLATGGCGFADDQIRYVLDGSPAARAGLLMGDRILTVDGKKYGGYLQFFGQEGKTLKLAVDRQGKHLELQLQPVKKDLYSLYVQATIASKRKIKQGKYSLGYVHLWAGGSDSAEAVKEILGDDFRDVDGLVYDLRDGYGGASIEDLDMFYRPAAAYPDCITKNRKGETSWQRLYFDKPVVVLINSGSRSGKELLAYSLKKSGRATLIGETTAGAVVAGTLFPIDDQCALYLAVADLKLKGKETERLEGVGVAPDITVVDKNHDPSGYGLQLTTAIDALEKRLASQN